MVVNSLRETKLHLNAIGARRLGMKKGSLTTGSLLAVIKNPNKKIECTMPPKDDSAPAQPKFKKPEDIFAEPDSSSDDGNPADMYTTTLRSGKVEGAKAETVQSKAPAPRSTAGRSTSRSIKKDIRVPKKKPTIRGSPPSSAGADSPKRKSQDEEVEVGARMNAVFGFDGTKSFQQTKKRKTQRPSFGKTVAHLPNVKSSSKDQKSKTGREYKRPPSISDSESEVEMKSPTKPKKVAKLLREEPEEEPKPVFKTFDIDESDDEGHYSQKDSPIFKNELLMSDSPRKLDADKPKSSFSSFIMPAVDDSPKRPPHDLNKPKDPVFIDYSFDDKLIHIHTDKINPPQIDKALLDQYNIPGDVTASLTKDKHTPSEARDFSSSTQIAHCPMCNKPVDAGELKALGHVNIRNQEKFCQSHQKKTAQEEWKSLKYPTIDWGRLESRILQHHSFIESLINGQDCHHRLVLEEVVRAGKDRTLRTSKSNLTPGYYGYRGLRAISESIMKEHTDLLKERAVTDRLVSARGVTAFVQSVLVPEVTVQLIREDMGVKSEEEARDILVKSVAMGELLHEEVGDVIENSDDDDY